MTHRKFIGGAAALSLALAAATGAAVSAQGAGAPKTTTIKEKASLVVKPNRYIQDGLRWDKDVYTVASGGTLKVINNEANEGPHTFTVVAKKDLPKTGAQVNHCKVCEKLGRAHGADPESNGPPKFRFLENGVGQATAPHVDRPGDSGVTGAGKKGESISLKVTAKAGTKLYFMCLIHPWMQAKVDVR